MKWHYEIIIGFCVIRFYSEVCTFELDVKIVLRFATFKAVFTFFSVFCL